MRSTMVWPSATRPAITRLAEARRSVAITVAPDSCSTPLTTASLPSTSIFAPRRTSSLTCMKRFSKIVSVIVDVPSAMQSSGHELGLHVGRERRVLAGAEAHRLQRAGARRLHADEAVAGLDRRAGLAQLLDHRLEVARLGVAQHDVAAGRRHRAQEGAGLDAVGHDAVRLRRRVQPVDALDADAARAVALDARAHRDQHLGQVGDLRLLRGVLEHGLALGQRRGHQQVLGAGDGDHVGRDARALQPRGRATM